MFEKHDDILEKFILKHPGDAPDMSKYFVEKITINKISIDNINFMVYFKSKKSEREFHYIDNKPMSMDFVVLKIYDMDVNEYYGSLRRKKMLNIENRISNI